MKRFLARLGDIVLRLRDQLVRGLRTALPTLVVCLPLVLMLSDGVADAKWVTDSSAVSLQLVWGMVCGWMLAGTRWSGWFATAYSLVVSAIVAALVVGEVLPAREVILTTAWTPLVDEMHLRLVAFGLRAGGWFQTLQAGGSVRDTGLFIVALALLGWGAAVWMMWWVVRRKRALVGILPIFSLMAINAHLSRQPRSYLLLFSFMALLAVARSAFSYSLSSWQKKRVDYSEDLSAEWGTAASLAAMCVVVFALLFSLVGTPEGIKILSNFVETTRREMSDKANQLFGGVNPPPPSPEGQPGDEPLPSVDTPNLGEIGTPLPQGNRTVMWVWVSDPPPVPADITGPPRELIAVRRHYWRSQIFTVYNGRGWELSPQLAGEASPDLDPDIPPGRYLLGQRYEIEARHSGVLFSVSDPVSATGATTLRRISPDLSGLLEGRASEYETKSLATNVTIADLELTETNYLPEIRTAYLQLPDNLPARIRRLAQEITAGAETPYRKAERIQEYLRTHYEYQIDTPPAAAGRDVVDYFLFDASGGFCSHYASAMVVMLRSVGVPARVVAGYAMGAFDQRRQMYRVPASASHAWVEVFFPGYGWVEFEPTPAYQVFVYPESSGAPVNISPRQAPLDLPAQAAQPGQLWWLLVPVGVVVVLWTVFLWGRFEKRRLEMPARAAVKLYWKVRRGLTQAGLPPQDSLTPDEFAAEILPVLELFPRLGDALVRATRVYIQSAYTPRAPLIDDVLMGEAAWSETRGERLRLWLQVRFGGE